MPAKYDRDFDWQRGLIPEVKRILANYLICEAPAEEDMHHGTDLIVLRLDTVRVACRLRRHKYLYLADYANEFTIRASRPSGAKTELAKILEGWGDYIFYAFASEDATELAAWTLGSLNSFRLWHHQELWRGRRPGISKPNSDGSSEFRAYPLASLPDDFVVARVAATRQAA